MAKKPTYEELEQKIKDLEKEAVEHKHLEEALRESEAELSTIYNNSQPTTACPIGIDFP